jgi:hypothetical protein
VIARNLPDLLIVAGAVAAVAGVALFSPRASLIVFGILSLALGVLLALRPKKS